MSNPTDFLADFDDGLDSVVDTSGSGNIGSSSVGSSGLKRDLSESGVAHHDEDGSSSSSSQFKKTKLSTIIPVHSSWFSLDNIHQNEVNGVPEFFSGAGGEGKKPEVYLNIRNTIITQFRKNPDVYLTTSDCRKIINGADITSIIRVYSFLEHWGLINYGLDPRNRPIKLNQPLEDGNQDVQVHNYTNDGQSLTEKFYCFQSSSSNNQDSKKEPKTSPPISNWTDHEILKLLEGVEKFKDDWDSIARHVQTRSKEECVLQFLQLPIEDEFLLEHEGLENSQYQDLPLPFADASNPIMHTVAFLSSTVSPSVAAAEAALNKIKEQSGVTEEVKTTNPQFDISKLDVQTASNAAIGAAAARAKEIATREERELQRLVAFVIEQQLKKLEKKIKYFEKLEKAMQQEREELEKARKQLHDEKMQFTTGSSSTNNQ